MSMETKSGAPQGGRQEGYERTDADVRSLLKFAFALFVILVAVIFSMKWMFFYFAKSQQLGPPASPFENARVLPPQPRLQVQPHLDLQAYCEDQLRQLESYGWVDPQNEVVRIPVDRAMDLVLQRGLPTRPAGSAAPGATAAADAEEMRRVPDAHDLQGPCGYIAKPPVSKEEK
jgi:hypothetical protein